MEASLIQLLVTWVRSHQTTALKTYINYSDTEAREKQLNDFGRRLFGITALYMTEKITTSQDTEIPKTEYAPHCSEVLKLMDQCDIHSSISVNQTYPKSAARMAAQFICLHGSRYEFQHSLYNGQSRGGTISRSDFEALIRSTLNQKRRHFSNYLEQNPHFISNLASLVYELFQNTNDHAYDNLDGESFTQNIRAISVKSVPFTS